MATRVSSPIFVGRRADLDLVSLALRAAIEGEPTVVLVAGEAGVGKTRFVAEAVRTLPNNARVLAGGCVDVAGETVPFAPIIEALRGLVRSTPERELDRLLGPGRAELAGLLPQLRESDGSGANTGLAYGSAEGRLFEAVLGLLDRLAASGVTVLVVEDLHWADKSTLDLLTFLTRNLYATSILLVLTLRSDELHRRHPLVPFLAELNRSRPTTRIDLAPFDRQEITAQLAAIGGRQPDAALVERIYARSEGNAFFAEELLAAGGSAAGSVPDSLREVLDARIGALSESSQELLRVAAVAGTRIQAALLGAVVGMDDVTLGRALREAVEHQILLPEDDAGSSQYRFRHTLLRDAVYADLLPTERTPLHTRFADALEATPDADRDASTAAEIAYHRFAAHDVARALDASVRAGLAAEAAGAFAEAQVQFEHALELWDQVPDAAERAGFDRVDMLARAANAASMGDAARAVAHIRRALELVDSAAEPERAGVLFSRLSRYYWIAGDGRAAQDAGREAVRLVPSKPPSVARARVTAGLGQILMVEGFTADSLPICEEAVAVARAVGARDVEGHALNSLGTDLGYLGDLPAGIVKLEEARDIARDVGNVEDVARAWANIVDLQNMGGLYEEAARLALETWAYDEAHGLARFYGASALCEGALALYRLGRWTDADAMLARLDRYQLFGNPELFVNHRRAALEIGRGEFVVAGARLAATAALLRNAVDPQWTAPFAELTAELSLWQNEPSAAARAIEEGLAMFTGRSVIVAGQVARIGPVYGLGLRAEADLAALARSHRNGRQVEEHVERGRAYLEGMRAMHEEIRQRLPSMVALGDAHRALCEAEGLRLDGRSAAAEWAFAADQFGRLNMRPMRTYSLWRQAHDSLTATRGRAVAAPLLREAHAIAVEIGAEPLRRCIEALAARARVDLTAPAVEAGARGGASDSFGLTSREREVLALVADGRTNRQIAESLFISEKTAGAHVSNILGKLDAAGRTEAAAIARRYGLVGDPGPT